MKNIDKQIIAKKGNCFYCGCNYKPFLTIDHIQPKSKGGIDDSMNKQVTCVLCNRLKANMDHKEFMQYRNVLPKLINLQRMKIHFHAQIHLRFSSTGKFICNPKDIEVKHE